MTTQERQTIARNRRRQLARIIAAKYRDSANEASPGTDLAECAICGDLVGYLSSHNECDGCASIHDDPPQHRDSEGQWAREVSTARSLSLRSDVSWSWDRTQVSSLADVTEAAKNRILKVSGWGQGLAGYDGAR